MSMQRKRKEPAAPSLVAKLIEEIYDELAAKMLIALYREKARAIKSLERRFKL